MKTISGISLFAYLALAFKGATAQEACELEKEVEISDATKLTFVGFAPNVERLTNTGNGNKVVLKNYGSYNVEVVEGDGYIEITRGEKCEETASSATKAFMIGVPMLFGKKGGLAATAALAFGFSAFGPSVYADDTAECSTVPIDVEIYVETTVEDVVNKMVKAGEYETCPPEMQYWEHPPSVFGGYTGCLAERGLFPCLNDALDVTAEDGAFYMKSGSEYWDGDKCVATGLDITGRYFSIRSGHPMDKSELVARTGRSPVVTLPFTRMPYPSYRRGADVDTDPQDESLDARVQAKEVLKYIGAFSDSQLAEFDVTITEGAEQGMVHIYAGKALEIAQTTCNRDIFVLVEVPAYGYSNSYSAKIVNDEASSFYNSSECLCFADDSCKEPTVTITTRGWFPGTDLPVEMGGDGNMYVADSPSPASPWFESMVFPENPSGVLKIPRHPDPNRRVCDGVYLWPMYFGARNFEIPQSEVPDCAAWSFSISKIYSAAARAGWMMYKEEPKSNHDAMADMIGTSQSLTHGSLSQWTWQGQMQLLDFFMEKPYTDPTSWIGAYSELLKEKWDFLLEGFEGCPIVTIDNPYSGAYAWFVKKPEYIGLDENNSAPSWMRDVLGIRAFAYNWGFRGANPADYYGEGYGLYDFTRLNMYRDVEVYEEIGRRAKIVCSDLDASLGGGLISFNEWEAKARGTQRRRLMENGYKDRHDRKRHLKEVVPSLTEEQLEYLAKGEEENEIEHAAIETCAPDYSTGCLMDKIMEADAAFL